LISGSPDSFVSHVLLNELFNQDIFVDKLYIGVAHWAHIFLFHALVDTVLAESVHAGDASCWNILQTQADAAHHLLWNFICIESIWFLF
jgi:hypothetical protein